MQIKFVDHQTPYRNLPIAALFNHPAIATDSTNIKEAVRKRDSRLLGHNRLLSICISSRTPHLNK
jgi:hypothetical protein